MSIRRGDGSNPLDTVGGLRPATLDTALKASFMTFKSTAIEKARDAVEKNTELDAFIEERSTVPNTRPMDGSINSICR